MQNRKSFSDFLLYSEGELLISSFFCSFFSNNKSPKRRNSWSYKYLVDWTAQDSFIWYDQNSTFLLVGYSTHGSFSMFTGKSDSIHREKF